MPTTAADPARFIDHTLLRADATANEIETLCEEAVELGFAAVCIPPCYVEPAYRRLYGSEVKVCTVVGFPLGSQVTAVKEFEARHAVDCGADEVDMVIRIGAARAGDFETVAADIRAVVAAVVPTPVKVIIECCYFDDAAKRRLAGIVAASGAAYVKTSTGFAAGGATREDVALLASAAPGIKVKAAGGIRDWPTCRSMIEAGAQRIGCSAGVAIVAQWRESVGDL
jgi:deoxyribose-phosphate aldolase